MCVCVCYVASQPYNLACMFGFFLGHFQSWNAGSSVGVDSDFPNLLGQSSSVGATSQDRVYSDESPRF